MENADLARVFVEMADILEILEGNSFRIRSFRRVAQILENLGFSAARAALEDPQRLMALPGIGAGTLKKVRELAETGECREHAELRAQIPPSLVTLLELPGLGPRKIAMFWRELQIATVDDLEAAASQHRLRSLPGMGEKTEEKILKGIQEYRRREGRFRLDYGAEVSEALEKHLRASVEIHRLAPAGSLRRRRETVGDLDLLVACSDPPAAMESLVRYPRVRDVLVRGDTKTSVVLPRQLQVDLRIVDESCFGAALQYFTGSKAHNVALRERAKRMGYKISEYGLFRTGDGEMVAGRDEAEIYRLLGLQPIPPELREDRGEIDLAERGELPRLVERTDLRGDLHTHSPASDGRDPVPVMARAAIELGYQYIGVTDHSKALAMVHGLDEEGLLRHIEELEEVSRQIPEIKILKGIEVDILEDGRLDLEPEVLGRLDVVIAAVHSHFNLTRKEMTRRICRALENQTVNVLAHPSGRLILRREPYEVDFETVMRTALDNRVCLEINAYPARLDLNDVHCRMAKDMGLLLAIDSDSHDRKMLEFIGYGVDTARRGWLTADDVINTYPLPKLLKILRKEEYR